MEKIGTKIFFRALLFLQTFHILLLLPPTLLSWDLEQKYQWCKTFTVMIRILQTLLSVRLPNTFAQTETICNALNSVHASVISVSASAASFRENATTQLLFLSSVFLSDEKEVWVTDSENAWWFQWSSLSKNKIYLCLPYFWFSVGLSSVPSLHSLWEEVCLVLDNPQQPGSSSLLLSAWGVLSPAASAQWNIL